ncbi:MAG: hypothetical protein JWQ27_2 [Ferruginibacter sp.]|nr:hypothetical protein [Ferruginibacter sp.]
MDYSAPTYEVEIHVQKDLLLLVAKGEYSLPKTNACFELAIDQALLHKKSTLLIDGTNVTGTVPFMDRYYFGEHLAAYRAQHALHAVTKIALLGKEPVLDKERFGETVAVNRGTNVRVFTDSEAAATWLQADT